MKKSITAMLISTGLFLTALFAGAVYAEETDSEEVVARTVYEMEQAGDILEDQEDEEIEEPEETEEALTPESSSRELRESGNETVYSDKVRELVEDILVSAGVLTSEEAAGIWSQANEKTEREQIIEFALQYVGNPYVYGGTSLTGGCDCSGFVLSVFSEFGYSLPRVAADQYNASTKKDPSSLEPGDLIFYENGIGHVAIYIGDGQIVHAANSELGIIVSEAEWTGPVGYGTFLD